MVLIFFNLKLYYNKNQNNVLTLKIKFVIIIQS